MRGLNIKRILNPVLVFLFLLGVGNCRRFVGWEVGITSKRRQHSLPLHRARSPKQDQHEEQVTGKAWSVHVNWEAASCLWCFYAKNLKRAHDGEAMVVCMFNCRNQWTDCDEACCSVVGYSTVLWSGRWVPTFRTYSTCCLHLLSLLKIWACSMFCRNVATFCVLLRSSVQGLTYLEDG